MIQILCVSDSIKSDGFTRIYDGTRYLTLFDSEKHDALSGKIRCLISLKSGITYIFYDDFAKINVDSCMTLHVIIHIKLVLNKY